jgi:hypothetical protein
LTVSNVPAIYGTSNFNLFFFLLALILALLNLTTFLKLFDSIWKTWKKKDFVDNSFDGSWQVNQQHQRDNSGTVSQWQWGGESKLQLFRSLLVSSQHLKSELALALFNRKRNDPFSCMIQTTNISSLSSSKFKTTKLQVSLGVKKAQNKNCSLSRFESALESWRQFCMHQLIVVELFFPFRFVFFLFFRRFCFLRSCAKSFSPQKQKKITSFFRMALLLVA